MRIEQIGAYGYSGQVAKAKRREEQPDESSGKRGKARFSRKDTFEPSEAAGKASSLKEVKKRVKSNFYSSDTVNEDLTEVFAKLLDR